MPPRWEATKRRILKRDNYQCYLCDEAADQVDHVVPHHLGGSDKDHNLKAICDPCHRVKSAREARAVQLKHNRW